MSSLLLIPIVFLSLNFMLYDFNSGTTAGKWFIVNDGVMGGISASDFVLNEDSTATFSGTVRPDYNGGFASIRSSLKNNLEANLTGVVIRLKGDGKIYSLRFRTSNGFDGISYQAKVQTNKNEWLEFQVPFNEFKATFRGRTLYNRPELRSENIRQIGILIADNQFGKFEVDVDWIKFY